MSGDFILTPNTVTETSNFLGYIGDPARSRIYGRFRSLIGVANEQYIASEAATSDAEFIRVGITDAVLLQLAERPCLLITDDLNLYLAAARRGHAVLNFTHYREARGSL